MGEVIVVTSGKGGVGKTTTTANIGAGLSRLDKKVVIIDTDLGLRNLDVVMGLENLIVYNLVDVIEGKCRMKQALIRDRRYENLYLLPSAQTKDKSAVSPGQIRKLTDELKEEFDYILAGLPGRYRAGISECHRRGRPSFRSDYTGGLCYPRCGSHNRTSGREWYLARHDIDHQSYPDGYGETRGYDVS